MELIWNKFKFDNSFYGDGNREFNYLKVILIKDKFNNISTAHSSSWWNDEECSHQYDLFVDNDEIEFENITEWTKINEENIDD